MGGEKNSQKAGFTADTLSTQRGIAATPKDLSHHGDTGDTEESLFVRSGDDDRTKNLLPSGITTLSEYSANSSEAGERSS
jgi:hypothetical protein